MNIYGRYVWYLDKKYKMVQKAGEIINKEKIMPHKYPNRFIRIGEWYDHENTPFLDEEGSVVRNNARYPEGIEHLYNPC